MRGYPFGRRHAVAAAVQVALGLAGVAMAGEPAAQAGDALAEVVVTAQFREQSVQDTPLSITAISAEVLEARAQTSIADIANQAPNVTLKPQGAAFGPSLGASIRGVGQFDFNPALEPGVGLYVDDVYFATLTGSILDLLDLERVEILRGPQGTLAGRNSIGGAVRLYSKKPTGEGGSVQATYGSRNRVDLRGSADFALADNLFARISGVSKKQDGYVQRRDYGCDNPTSGVPVLSPVGQTDCVVAYDSEVNYSAARAQLRWVPTDDLEIGASIDYTKDDRNPAGSVLVDARPVVNPNIQPVPGVTNLPLNAFVFPRGVNANYASYYNPPATFRRLNAATLQPVVPAVTTPALETRPRIGVDFSGWGAAANIDWKLGERLALQSISAYREYDSYFANDNDLSPLASSLGFGNLAFHSFSQEIRLNGTAFDNDRLHYTVGAFYMDQLSVYRTVQDLRYNAASLTQFQGNDPVNADTTAFFGHVSYQLFDKLTVNLGLRHTDEHKDYTFRRKTYSGAVSPALGAIDGLTSNYDRKQWDQRVNLQYAWTDSIMTYAEYATGFKGGGISPRPFSAAQAVPFNPEELESYEIGVKSDFFDRRLRVNASVFQSDYTDLQLTLAACPQFGVGLPCAVVANAGDAEVKGVELELVVRPVGALTIDGAISYLDFDYTRINPAAGGPGRPTGPQFGMRPAYVPKQKWSLGVQYDWTLGDLGSLSARVDAAYQGQLFANGANAATNSIDSYTIANARLAWKSGSGNWETALELTNFTDEYYFLTRFDQFTLTGLSDGQPGRPREWALMVRRQF